MKFNLGDRVLVKESCPFSTYCNETGTVVAFSRLGNVGVMFDKEGIGAHTCSSCAVEKVKFNIPHNSCYWISEKDCQLIIKNKIHIEIDSDNVKNTTLVMTVGNQAVKSSAKCAPEDEFDLTTGISLCLERALKKLEAANKLMNGRYVYIAHDQPGLTKGKIYIFIDGMFIDDDGYVRPFQNSRPPFTKDGNYAKQFAKVVE